MIDEKAILVAIRDQYVLAWNGLHGVSHWARVFENGMLIAKHTEALENVVLLFALFHDACRVNDGIDPGHGTRGAKLAASYRGRYFELPDHEFDLLNTACADHTKGLLKGDITLQTCWDADRLDLARAGISPVPKRMCTEVAKEPETLAWANERSLRRHVPDLVGSRWNLGAK